MRAPIEVRTPSARVCAIGAPYEGDSAGSWIGVEPGNQGAISQIGLVKIANPDGSTKTCRFYANQGGQVHTYGCDWNDQGGDRVFFQIEALPNPDTGQGHYYYLEDCGKSGGYAGGNCVTHDASQSAWGDAGAYVFSEVGYPCSGDYMPGGPDTPVHFGTSAYPVQTRNSFDGSFNTRDWTGTVTGACTGHYHRNVTPDVGVGTWDDRN